MTKDVERPKLDDIHDKHGTYVFTDGCGNISKALCDMINDKFGLIRCSAY